MKSLLIMLFALSSTLTFAYPDTKEKCSAAEGAWVCNNAGTCFCYRKLPEDKCVMELEVVNDTTCLQIANSDDNMIHLVDSILSGKIKGTWGNVSEVVGLYAAKSVAKNEKRSTAVVKHALNFLRERRLEFQKNLQVSKSTQRVRKIRGNHVLIVVDGKDAE